MRSNNRDKILSTNTCLSSIFHYDGVDYIAKEGDCNGDDEGGGGGDDDDDDDEGGGDPDLHVPESRESLKVLRHTGELIVLEEEISQLNVILSECPFFHVIFCHLVSCS